MINRCRRTHRQGGELFEVSRSTDKTLQVRMAERKAVIKSADMSEDMQQDAVDCASQALEKYNIEKVMTYIHIPLAHHYTGYCSLYQERV
jgi:coproporphyrinogen III oxidase-like Fe-S oxidoreductase